jgi:hypothetical protein
VCGSRESPCRISLNSPRPPSDDYDWYIVGNFHTHPVCGGKEEEWASNPSGDDVNAAAYQKVPGIVKDQWRVFGYGFQRRLEFSSSKDMPGWNYPIWDEPRAAGIPWLGSQPNTW